MVPLKHLSIFWRTIEMPRINWELTFILIWYANCFIPAGTVANINQKKHYKDKHNIYIT